MHITKTCKELQSFMQCGELLTLSLSMVVREYDRLTVKVSPSYLNKRKDTEAVIFVYMCHTVSSIGLMRFATR